MNKINCTDGMPPVAVDSHSSLSPEPGHRSILVVDDEDNFLILLHWFLSQRGYDVTTASNADEALGLTSNRSFDVALLDVRLGTEDGVALLEQLLQRVPELKVIMMTAYPTVGSIKQAFDKGAVRYLTKPVDLPDLAAAIKVLF